MSSHRLARREPAQIVALFAIGLLALLAMVGVVVDGGTLYVQRRTAQNAADAAALAGTRALQRAAAQRDTTIGTAICTYLQANSFGVTPTATAYFVDTSGTSNLGPISPGNGSGCGADSSWIPIGASGVHVDVTVGPYNTYLAGIVGIRQLAAVASATAQVGVLSIPGADLTPLAGCGPDMLVDGKSPTPSVNLLNPDNLTINTALYTASPPIDVVLQGAQMSKNEGASCPSWGGSSAWKGKLDLSGYSGPLAPPITLPVDNGNGTIDSVIVNTCKSIYGSAGDPTGKDGKTSQCYLLVPIAAPPNPPDKANIVTLACFRLYDGGNGDEKWRGVLVPISSNTCTYGIYPPNWVWSQGNSFSETQVKLTN